jgi:hypothetical protein
MTRLHSLKASMVPLSRRQIGLTIIELMDHSLVPINTDFDLYSMGPDGRNSPPLTAKHSRDDIVRANNGAFIGVASDY